jgi:hypothetical protein
VGSRRLRCVLGLVVMLVLAAGATSASAASPVLEFASPLGFPVGFTAEGGAVSAALSNFDTEVHCTGSRGEGTITGPRSTSSSYTFTGCETQGGSKGGHECRTENALENEITTPLIEGELAFIDQEKMEVGVVLDPLGGLYMEFECAGENVKAFGPFLSPVGPINQEGSAFTATLSRSGATQIPSAYETLTGEKLPAVPTGEREFSGGTTGVELSFAIHTSVPLTVKAISAAEIEAKQRDEEAAAKKRHDDEEAAKAAAAARKHGEEEATKRRLEEEAAKRRAEEQAKAKGRARQLAKALKQCRKSGTTRKRVRCEHRAKKRYGAHRSSKR